MPRNRSESALKQARSARRTPSVAERIMWEAIRADRLGFKFRREHPVGRFRLDFYCAEAKLAVELDGEQHNPERDRLRDKLLEEHGILTYRIPNLQFFLIGEQPYVDDLKAIQRLCESRTGRPSFPA